MPCQAKLCFVFYYFKKRVTILYYMFFYLPLFHLLTLCLCICVSHFSICFILPSFLRLALPLQARGVAARCFNLNWCIVMFFSHHLCASVCLCVWAACDRSYIGMYICIYAWKYVCMYSLYICQSFSLAPSLSRLGYDTRTPLIV